VSLIATSFLFYEEAKSNMMIESKDRYVIVNGKAYDVIDGFANVPDEEIEAEIIKLGKGAKNDKSTISKKSDK